MTRTVKTPEERKQELINIALDQFLKNGYEKTSVRGILHQAGGKIGMFYHYFESKNEIFDAALKRFNERYIRNVERIIEDKSMPLMERIDLIFTNLPVAMFEYENASQGAVNPEMKIILLASTLNTLCPIITALIQEAVDTGIVRKLPIDDIAALSRFILFGVSGVIHDDKTEMAQRTEQAKELLINILGIHEEV